jgi:hypothetical protein
MCQRIVCGVLLVGVLLLTGCGGMSRVEGYVTLDGQPLEGALVVFTPEEGGTQASGKTDGTGYFRLSSFRRGDGARQGNYRILVTLPDPPPDVNITDDMSMAEKMKTWAQAMAERKKKGWKPAFTLPAVYAKADTTPFAQRIPVWGKVRLELSSTAK